MNVAFRFDSTLGIGTGHAYRMLNLAVEFRRFGLNTFFITSAMTNLERLPPKIRQHPVLNTQVTLDGDWDLRRNPDFQSNKDRDFEIQDAVATRNICENMNVDLVVLDHYFLNQNWVDVVSECGLSVVAIDDIGRDWRDLFALIDYSPNPICQYPNLGSESVRLFGLRYVILGREYQSTVRKNNPGSEIIQVFTGGSDQTGLTVRIVESLKKSLSPTDRINVIIGRNNEFLQSTDENLANHPQILLHTGLMTLSEMNSTSSWAVGAGGVAALERCALGVPSLIITIAENQIHITKELDKLGMVKYLGHFDEVSDLELDKAISSFKNDHDLHEQLSKNCHANIDTYGSTRIALMVLLKTNRLYLRSARLEDSGLIHEWANDESVRRNSLNSEKIGIEEHTNWYSSHFKSDKSRIYVLESNGIPIGQIRFETRPDGLHIDYSIDFKFRGLGLGKKIVELGIDKMLSSTSSRFFATVKEDNLASIHVFDSLGFRKLSLQERGTVMFEFNGLKTI